MSIVKCHVCDALNNTKDDKQRTGTFWCWLWGHKFMYWADAEKQFHAVYPVYTNNCVRCGINKES